MSELIIPDYTKFVRNEYGLLPGVEYKYKLDGFIDWKKMIKKEFLVVQKGKEAKVVEKYGKEIGELDLSTVDESYLMILLGGIKDLVQVRGILKYETRSNFSSPHFAEATATIKYMGNYETNMQDVVFSGSASASHENTNGFGQQYLATIAENRSFARAIRNFLNINIVSKDELKDGTTPDAEDSNPISGTGGYPVLIEKIEEKNIKLKQEGKKLITFEDVKNAALTKYRAEINGDPAKWTTYSDIQKIDIWTLLGKFK